MYERSEKLTDLPVQGTISFSDDWKENIYTNDYL